MLKVAAIYKQKYLARFLTIAAVAQIYLSSVATLISSTAVLKLLMDIDLTLQTWSLTHPIGNVAEVEIGNAEVKTSDSHEMILFSMSEFRIV